MIRIRGIGACTAVAAGLLVLALAPSDAAARAPRMGVLIPDPGHVSFAVSGAEVRADKASELPKRAKLGFPKAKKLPESVRLVWATRVLRRGRRATYATAVLIVNQAPSTPTRAKRADAPEGNPDNVRLIWDMFVADADECDGCWQLFAGNEISHGLCDSCKQVSLTMFANRNADEGTSKGMRKKITDLFKDKRDNVPSDLIFDEAPAVDPSLETGHYDDGHAFGWGVKTKRDERDLLEEAAQAILRRKQSDDFLASLEQVIRKDLNGDGIVGGGPGIAEDGGGTFSRHPQCQFVTDPPNCSYLAAAVGFKSSFRAFQIEIPGYRVQPGELTAVYNAGGAEIGSCSPFEPTVVHCNLDFAVGDGAVVTTQIEPATLAQPEGVRLPDGTGGELFKASPSPMVERLGGPYPILGP